MAQCPQHTFQVLTKRSERLRQMAPQLPWPTNVWMGVSVEDQRVVSRITDLAAVRAHVRFLSIEPLLGPLDNLELSAIDWAIVGGESGPGARPMQEAWVQSIRCQCEKIGVAFFFKQWGGVNKHATGRILNGRTYDQMPKKMGTMPSTEARKRISRVSRKMDTSPSRGHRGQHAHRAIALPLLTV